MKDENQGAQNAGFPLTNLPLGDFDPSTLQIISNEDLEELKELGSGTFGTVYHGKWRGTDVAIKRIKKTCFTGRSSEQERLTEFWREAEILSKLHHPNVVAFYGVVKDGPGGTLATVAEFMVNGSLRHVLLCKDRHLDRRKRLIIARYHFDFLMDQILAYLIMSASSSAATRAYDWISNWGKDEFTEMASASIGVSFLAFIAFAFSSLISGYNFCNRNAS